MKKILLILLSTLFAVAYNFNGIWLNQKRVEAKYNDPIKIVIKNGTLTPYIKRSGKKIAKLKPKYATKVQNLLYEAWGFENKSLVLLIQPLNSTKIKVIAKKIDLSKKKILTKIFYFKKYTSSSAKTKAFLGTWVNYNPFSAVSKMKISLYKNDIIIKAWRPVENKNQYLGAATATIKGNKLYIRWIKQNLIVKATIVGEKYYNNSYHQLRMYIKATNSYTGISNEQTIIFKRKNQITPPPKPYIKHIKLGPIDLNLLIKSY